MGSASDASLGQQAARGTAPRGLQDEKLQQLKYDLHWCLSKNDWWFTGAGIILGGALSWMTGSIKPFAAAAILAPAADWAYGRAVCSEYEQAYSAYRKQRLEECKEQAQELREVLKAGR